MSLIDQLAGCFDDAAEVGIADGLLGHQIHRSLEKFFDGIGQVQEPVGIIAGGLAVGKANEKIQIAGFSFETAIRGGAKQIKAFDLELLAKLGQFTFLFFHQRNHTRNLTSPSD